MLPLRRRSLAGLAGGLVSAMLTQRQAGAQGRAAAQELRIGAIFPAAGPLALLGDESFRGLELAVEARNQAGGLQDRTIRLVKAEATDAAQAGDAVKRLATAEKVTAIFGTAASPLSFAATQVAELQSLPYFELGAIADSITVRGFRYVFRSCPRAADFAILSLHAALHLLPRLWRLPPSAVQVAVLHEDGLYGQSVAAAQEAGLRDFPGFLGRFAYAPGGQDLPALVQRLRSAGADLLLHTGHEAEILALFRAMREAFWRPRMVVGSGGGYSLGDTAQTLGPAIEGVMNVCFQPYAATGRAGAEAAALAEAYREKYGHEPRSGHSLANYAGAAILLDAMQRAGSMDRERIRAAVLDVDLPIANAPLGWPARFDETGQNIRALPVLSQWQGGRLVPIHPDALALRAPRAELG